MSTGTIVGWDAPTGVALSGLSVGDVGMVVCVRIRPQAGNNVPLTPDANGRCPHLVYTPDRAPDGTGGFQQRDAYDHVLGEIVDKRPRSMLASSMPEKRHSYRVDLGVPFVCPWPAAGWGLDGGATAGNIPSPQDVEIVASVPLLSGVEWNVPGEIDGLIYQKGRNQYYTLGSRPLGPPTLTFRNVTTNALLIPYGAVAVVVNSTTAVRFTDPGGTPDDIVVTAGAPLPLGFYALGTTFALPPGGAFPATPIQRLVFILEIA